MAIYTTIQKFGADLFMFWVTKKYCKNEYNFKTLLQFKQFFNIC